MTPQPSFHFKADVFHLLKWFHDSPDTGDPHCICSLCGELIKPGTFPFRAIHRGTEVRLHVPYCAGAAIQEFSRPQPETMKVIDRLEVDFAEMCGYKRGERYLGVYWTPGGDELTYDDGRYSLCGANFWQFLEFSRIMGLHRYSFGDSENEAVNWLIWDSKTKLLWYAPKGDAREFLRQQWNGSHARITVLRP